MKKLRYLAVAALLMGLSSCGDDWLNVQPSTEVETGNSIKVLSDIEFTLNGIYSEMQSSDAYSGRLVYYGDATGDDMQAVSPTKRCGNYYRFNWTKDNGPSTHWSVLYSIITSCNLILNKIDAVPSTDDEAEYKDDMRGQALAIRGLAYFDLTRIFGYPYLKDQGASMGVPLILAETDRFDKPSRATVAQCYDRVVRDLKDACTYLDTGFNKGKMNRWAAMTLLSRVYLYMGQYDEAFTAAKNAIDGAEAAGYELWSNEEYPYAWANDASATHPGEVLFEIVNETTDSPGKESMGYLSSKDGYDDICITVSFYHLLMQDPDDVRLKLLDFDGDEYAYVNKYQPQEGEDLTDANIPLIRLSEAYLNAAEAAVRTKNPDAYIYLDKIVNRANPQKHVTAEDAVTLEQVLTERRKELVGEGHRMFDAVRDGGKVHRVDEADDALSETAHETQYMDFGWEFYKIVLPVPKHEMNANPNMKQNPGYGD